MLLRKLTPFLSADFYAKVNYAAAFFNYCFLVIILFNPLGNTIAERFNLSAA